MNNKIMARKLISILRVSDRNTPRKDIALALAHTKELEAVEELKRMLRGYVWIRDWKKLWLSEKIDCWDSDYDAEKQLIAIDALGETKSPEALECLERLIDNPIQLEEIVDYEESHFKNYIPGRYTEITDVVGLRFKNMNGMLDYTFTLSKGDGIDLTIPNYLEWASKKPEYHKIKNSINKLQNCLTKGEISGK